MDNLLASLDTAQTYQHDLHLGRMIMPQASRATLHAVERAAHDYRPVALSSTQNRGGNIKWLTERRSLCSKVRSKKTCNYNNYGHDADDIENVHCVLRLRYARLSWLPPRARSSVDELRN